MNKLVLKNTFTMLLAGLLIICMMIIQGPAEGEMNFKYWIGLIIVIACVIFVVYQTFVFAKRHNQDLQELKQIKTKLAKLTELEEKKTEEVPSSTEEK